MTLIIGIKCRDGVVIGSDGAATLGSMGQSLIRQPTAKLDVIKGTLVSAVSGPVGMAQRITALVEEMWSQDKFIGKKPAEAMGLLRTELFNRVINAELQAAAVAKNAVGPQVANMSALSATLIAMPLQKSACLFQFDQQAAPEEVTDRLPFAAIGIGETLASPFLAFIRRIFWSKGPPSVSEGVFATLWTLEHAIGMSPGGVADPRQVAVLQEDGKSFKVHEYADDDLAEHYQAIKDAENSLATFRDRLSDEKSGDDDRVPHPE